MSRPEILFRYFEPVGNLKGVGARNEALLGKLGLTRIRDLIFDAPEKGIERQIVAGALGDHLGQYVILQGEVMAHHPASTPQRPYRIDFEGNWGRVALVYFKASKAWLNAQLPEGAVRALSGKLESYQGAFQISHPEFIANNADEIPRFEAQYGLTEGLSQKQMQKLMAAALDYVAPLPEWIDAALLKAQNWPAWDEAIRALHAPLSFADLTPHSPIRRRLAYDELLSYQLALALFRAKRKAPRGRQIAVDAEFFNKAKSLLPYELTGAQSRAMDEIMSDFASPNRMFRLVQGDVGAGKTAVAFLAMAVMAKAGLQAAMVAPTEILAQQHFETLKPYFDQLGFQTVLLTGSQPLAERRHVYEALENGTAQLAFGTHALFQDKLNFANLGLSVVDEQHRFGVAQRAALSHKGQAVDLLAMSATPIPRSLAMTIYGEMDISILDEKPPGRTPVKTSILSVGKLDAFIERLKEAVAQGRQAYWVCPLVEESAALDYTAAQARYRDLRQRLVGVEIGLLHGQMPSEEKDAVMRRFAAGEIQILVATTVIEVGVDVPNATIMAIEGADRFGLSQLHQLRGRVGRGDQDSYCVLIYSGELSEASRQRLELMRASDDGFEIAEVDMKMRGAGDLLGRAQSGLPRFQIANLEAHQDLMNIALQDARLIVETDPDLQTKRGEALRVLLYLMERDQAIAILRTS